MKHTPKKKGKENIVEKHIKRIKKWDMRERGMLKGAWDQGMWIKVLTWELQEVRSYSSLSCSSNNNWISNDCHTSRGQEKIHQVIWNHFSGILYFKGLFIISIYYILHISYIVYFIYYKFIYYIYIYIYIYIYEWQCQVVSFEFSVIPKRVWQEFRRRLRGSELVWLGETNGSGGLGHGLGPDWWGMNKIFEMNEQNSLSMIVVKQGCYEYT